jgi:hypothetical protein
MGILDYFLAPFYYWDPQFDPFPFPERYQDPSFEKYPLVGSIQDIETLKGYLDGYQHLYRFAKTPPELQLIIETNPYVLKAEDLFILSECRDKYISLVQLMKSQSARASQWDALIGAFTEDPMAILIGVKHQDFRECIATMLIHTYTAGGQRINLIVESILSHSVYIGSANADQLALSLLDLLENFPQDQMNQTQKTGVIKLLLGSPQIQALPRITLRLLQYSDDASLLRVAQDYLPVDLGRVSHSPQQKKSSQELIIEIKDAINEVICLQERAAAVASEIGAALQIHHTEEQLKSYIENKLGATLLHRIIQISPIVRDRKSLRLSRMMSHAIASSNQHLSNIAYRLSNGHTQDLADLFCRILEIVNNGNRLWDPSEGNLLHSMSYRPELATGGIIAELFREHRNILGPLCSEKNEVGLGWLPLQIAILSRNMRAVACCIPNTVDNPRWQNELSYSLDQLIGDAGEAFINALRDYPEALQQSLENANLCNRLQGQYQNILFAWAKHYHLAVTDDQMSQDQLATLVEQLKGAVEEAVEQLRLENVQAATSTTLRAR